MIASDTCILCGAEVPEGRQICPACEKAERRVMMMKNDNKKRGNGFEDELCAYLGKHGFWAHNMAQRTEGQPADVIAAKNGTPYLIDCKVCTQDYFALSRIEPNQHTAMRLWRESGNREGLFALKFEKTGDTWLIAYDLLEHFGKTRISRDEVCVLGVPLEWLVLRHADNG